MTLTRRQARAAWCAVAGAALGLAAGEIGGSRQVRGTAMLTLAVVAVSAVISSPASAKARQTAQRLDAFLNNGGYIGGNLVVNGDHSVTTLHVNGTQKKMRQGPTTSPPGGAPGSYTPSYESSLSQMGADANTTGHNAGDWS